MAGTREGGLKSAEKIKEKFGSDYYKKIGQSGGIIGDKSKTVQKTKERYGEDFYRKVGKLGADKRDRNKLKKELVDES